MQSMAWATLLRHIPREVYHNLMVVTRSRTEIAIQTLLRVDHEFVALQGRLAGSQDGGRVFFVAYDQIDYFGFQDPVKESEFHQLFDSLVMPVPDAPAPPAAAPADTGAEATFAAAMAAAAAGDAGGGDGAGTSAGPGANEPGSRTTNPVIKSAVLERFRARSQAAGGSGARPKVNG
jgi:hypothetical protein